MRPHGARHHPSPQADPTPIDPTGHPMNNTLISLTNVTYTYPGTTRPALHNLNLEVEEGEFLLVAGVSGAGKSTLLRLFNGLVP
ncbi:MAG: ATP-binding cassette domain-containing protein, partial [Chloroflexia bacterium]